MKRLIIALLLIAAAVTAACAELAYVGSSTDGCLEQIERADGYVRQGKLNDALRLCRSISESWDGTAQKIDVLLIHDYVDSISVSLAQMEAHLENGNADMYFSDSAGAKKGLASIKGSEYPNFENIL